MEIITLIIAVIFVNVFINLIGRIHLYNQNKSSSRSQRYLRSYKRINLKENEDETSY